MVTGPRTEGGSTGTHMLSAKVRKTIQSIREIVGNHSDSDIYVALKESNMDPNETTQKLLHQDPFHEVKRRRDRKKETQDFGNKSLVEPRRQSENGGQELQIHTPSEQNGRRTNYSRNPLPRNPLPRVSREFRVVRDNRVNHIDKEVKPPSLQHSTTTAEQVVVNTPEKKGSSAAYTSQRSLNGPSDSHDRQSKDAVSNVSDRKITDENKQGTVLNASAPVQPTKPNSIPQNSSTNASTSSAMGVYSSSTDPVHVPSPDSRSPGIVGAIRREVGVVGVRRLSSDNKAKQLFVPSSSHGISLVGKDGPSTDSVGSISKPEQYSQTTVTEPSFPGMSASKPSLNNLHNSRPHQQLVGHQRVSQHNKEWKPKSSQKANSSPGVIGTPKKTVSPPAQDSENVESESAKLTDNLSKVTIAQHICVAETDRLRLSFGTLGVGAKLDFLGIQSKYHIDGATEKSSGGLTTSVVPALELSSGVSGNTQVDMLDDEHIRNLVSDSPAASEQQLSDNKESSSPQNLDNYANIGLERDTSRPFVPSESQQQDFHDMPGFSAYDPPNGYDIPYFRPSMEETVRGRVLSPPHEGLSSHAGNSVPMTTISMVQQQQPPMAQMYPQVHVSHYANLMPYRQYLSPVYVPPMAVQGYSNNSPYPHPNAGNSYLLMPGGSSHLNANNLKYGVQQFKPVPAGSPTGFGNFGNPTGYAMVAPGVVGGATALEDSSRVKYKDNLYVPNPQGETSEIWLQNPRDISGMQSSPYYNMPPGQSPHAAAFMPSQHGHHGNASFNAAAAAAQSSHNHMQFPAGMYHTHTPPQQAPHHLGNNVGVGVGVAAASPGAQVGPYQQPQLSQFNWTTSF